MPRAVSTRYKARTSIYEARGRRDATRPRPRRCQTVLYLVKAETGEPCCRNWEAARRGELFDRAADRGSFFRPLAVNAQTDEPRQQASNNRSFFRRERLQSALSAWFRSGRIDKRQRNRVPKTRKDETRSSGTLRSSFVGWSVAVINAAFLLFHRGVIGTSSTKTCVSAHRRSWSLLSQQSPYLFSQHPSPPVMRTRNQVGRLVYIITVAYRVRETVPSIGGDPRFSQC